MAMGTVFRSKGSENLTTYSFDDISSGTGFVYLYGSQNSKDGTSNIYRLTPTIHYTQQTYISAAISNANNGLATLDIDFDMLMNKTTIIKGDVICNVPVRLDTTAGARGNIKVKCLVRKWDGSTETEISGTGGLSIVYDDGATGD